MYEYEYEIQTNRKLDYVHMRLKAEADKFITEFKNSENY
jgi:hypothetical protein